MTRLFGTPARQYLAPAVIWLLAAGYLAEAYSYPADSRAFPAMVAWAMIVLVGLDLLSRTATPVGRVVTRWLNPATGEHKTEGITHSIGRQVVAMLWVAGFAAALVILGVLTAIPLFVFGSMRLRGGRPLLSCVLTAGGATLFIWLLFAVVLRLQLYPGLLFGAA
jgi:Tripartite tricarboxylate transporter TctB family